MKRHDHCYSLEALHGRRAAQRGSFESVALVLLLVLAVFIIPAWLHDTTTGKLDKASAELVEDDAAKVATADAAEVLPSPGPLPVGLFRSVQSDPGDKGTWTLSLLIRPNNRYIATLYFARDGEWLMPSLKYEKSSSGKLTYAGSTIKFEPETNPGVMSGRFAYAMKEVGFSLADGTKTHRYHPVDLVK